MLGIVKKIAGWKTSDGEIHHTAEEALKREREIVQREKLEVVIGHMWEYRNMHDDDEFSADNFLEHKEELIEALSEPYAEVE